MLIKQPPLKIAMTFERQSACMAQGYSYEDCSRLADASIDSISETLRKLGHEVDMVGDIQVLVKRLAQSPSPGWDLVFNISKGWQACSAGHESRVPALLEAFAINFTFSDSATIAKVHDKALAKIVLGYHGIRTAPYAIVKSLDSSPLLVDPTPAQSAISASPHSKALAQFPLFVKPTGEGSSKGISKASKVTSASDLEPVVRSLRARFPEQDILIESFLSGNDMTISILGTGSEARVIGVREWKYGGHARDTDEDFQSFERKMTSRYLWPYHCDTATDLSEPLTAKACETALAAYGALGCRDLGRVDIRFDRQGPDGQPSVIEINPIPGLTEGYSPLPVTAKVNGIDYDQLISLVIDSAMQRAKT
ncbi:hypothetical protein FRB95_009235 [Tulasnella sp. JGI-2019a]|nr:hypothetical protein FRB95_009235 [Tulasnella sp. JGI-2019a]